MPSRLTGPAVPGWVREEIHRLEREWPLRILACAAGVIVLWELILGAVLWRIEPVFYYGHP